LSPEEWTHKLRTATKIREQSIDKEAEEKRLTAMNGGNLKEKKEEKTVASKSLWSSNIKPVNQTSTNASETMTANETVKKNKSTVKKTKAKDEAKIFVEESPKIEEPKLQSRPSVKLVKPTDIDDEVMKYVNFARNSNPHIHFYDETLRNYNNR
jgi:hypothetical protein